MTAAATAGGVLAVVMPTVAVASGPASDVSVVSAAAFDASTAGSTDGPTSDVAAPVLRPAAVPVGLPAVADGTTVRLLASLVPVADTRAPEPQELEVSELLKAAGLADVARRAEEAKAVREQEARCDTNLGGLGRVKPWVREAARFLSCLYGEPTLIGVAGRSRASDHPSGLAVDMMVGRGLGDRIAECALANQQELGISYVIWRQRVNYGDGWESMSDRGGITANHYDHVHISFERGGPGGEGIATRCS